MKESDTLRVMFYDKSEWAGEHLTSSWFAGGLLYKAVRRLDVCVGVDSWDQALDWLATYDTSKKISMIQYWGHGSPGKVWINGEALTVKDLRVRSDRHSKMVALKERLSEDATIWFRCCNVFTGETGYDFGRKFTEFMDCTIAAHTFIIGPFQSGLYTLEPGQEPYWPVDEGVDEDGKMLWSHFWKPRTIFCLRGTIPKGW